MKNLLLLVTTLGLLMPAKYNVLADKNEKLHKGVKEAIELLKKSDPSLDKFFKESFAYSVFPKIAKGGFGVGAAHGNGEVYEKGKMVGRASMSQISIGLQLGGQVYIEVIFFENEKVFKDFKNGKLKFSAQASAVAAAEGVAKNAKYELGVLIFTLAKNGLMYEAGVGGQKFKFKPFEVPPKEE